jgi:Protein of unknown function (DUF669)
MRNQRAPGDDDDAVEVDLASLDQDFAAAPAPTPTTDGRYRVRVERVVITTTRTSRRPVVKWMLRIVAPACQGRLLWKNSVLGTPDNLRWLKHDLRMCGLDLDKLSDLPSHLAQLLGIELDVTKRTDGDWENIHFNRRVDGNGSAPF